MNGLADPTNEVVIETAGALRFEILLNNSNKNNIYNFLLIIKIIINSSFESTEI